MVKDQVLRDNKVSDDMVEKNKDFIIRDMLLKVGIGLAYFVK